MRVSLTISDPWEVGEALGWERLPGELLLRVHDEHGGRALIKLDSPITYGGSTWRFVVAAPRLVGKGLAGLDGGETVGCGFIGICDQQASSSLALDTSHWRGGLAFIAGLEAHTNEKK